MHPILEGSSRKNLSSLCTKKYVSDIYRREKIRKENREKMQMKQFLADD